MTDAATLSLRPGFLGLGNIGQPIAANLARAFPGMLAYDAAGTEQRLPADAVAADGVAPIAGNATHIFLSLPSKNAVKSVVEAIVASHGPALRVVVDLSTIGVETAKEAAAALSAIGIAYIDAPVSGGTAGARAGTITVMCAGDRAAYDDIQPLLKAVATKIFHVGDLPGQGQALKLLNNFLAATTLAATSEAISFGLREGLAMGPMLDVLNVSSGQSAATSDKFVRQVATGAYSAGFANTLMLKDLNLFAESAGSVNMLGPVGEMMLPLWEKFESAMPGADFTRIHEYMFESLSGDDSAPT